MDRTAFAVCAGLLLPLGALSVGCDSQHAPPGPRTARHTAPKAVLLELQAAAPGPWKLEEAPVTPAMALSDDSESFAPLETPVADDETRLEFAEPQNEAQLQVAPGEDKPAVTEDVAPPVAAEPADEPAIEPADITPIEDDSLSATEPAPPHSNLPWANAAPHSDEMLAVIERADVRVRRGFQLAARDALFSAQAEFVNALQLIAAANDTQQNTRLYTTALDAGLVALNESNVFVSRVAGKGNGDVGRLIAGHKTPILKNIPASELTPMLAAQRYYTYAQEQLSAAAAQEMTGSMALFGLGKVAMSGVGPNKPQQLESTAQAMVLYQAALMADANNFRAANELGVLMADNGQLQRAREMLQRSVSLSSQPATWHNLAVVHARLGEIKLAEEARARELAMPRPSAVEGAGVQWVDATTFSKSAPPSDGLTPVASTPRTMPVATQPSTVQDKPAESVAKKGLTDWLPWSTRR